MCTVSALLMFGSDSVGNSTSTTLPRTWTTFPVASLWAVAVALTYLPFVCVRVSLLRASAPPTISKISLVIAAWRALFISTVFWSISFLALSVALFIATSWAA